MAGEYKLVPRSACLGGKVELIGDGNALELEGKNVKGELIYGAAGKLTGSAVCSAGDEAGLVGAASNRDITLTITRDQPPEGAPRARRSRPRRSASSRTCSPPSSSRWRS